MRLFTTSVAASLLCCAAAGPILAETPVHGRIAEDQTWTRIESPYVLEKTILVEEGVTLRVEPGVVVHAAGERSGLLVRGSLVAEGRSEEPIVFAPARGSAARGWMGIRFEAPGGPVPSGLVHVEIRGAGSRSWHGLRRPASLAIEAPGVSIRDSAIVDGRGEGILLADGATAEIARSEIRGNAGHAIWANDADSTRSALSEILVRGNRPDAFRIEGQLDASATWTAEIPFLLERDVVVAPGARLTLLPGATVKGASSKTELRLRGRIVAKGTPEAPVVFTSAADDSVGGDTNGDGNASSPAPGEWMGITLEGFLGGGGGTIESAEIRYAGGLAWQRYGRPAGLTTEVSDLVLRDVRILDGGGDGILLALGAWPTIERTEIRGCRGDAIFATEPDSTRATLSRNRAAGNGLDAFAIGGTLSHGAVWRRDLPYVLERSLEVAPEAFLTIEPGVVVKAVSGASIRVQGGIAARGEAGSPIVFTSFLDDSVAGDTNGDRSATSPAPGDWGGIAVRSTVAGSAFRNVAVRFGGSQSFGAEATEAGLYVESPSLEVLESRIERNAHAGIRIWGGAPRISGNTITGNAIGILATHGSAAIVEGNDLTGNAEGGLAAEECPGLRVAGNREAP